MEVTYNAASLMSMRRPGQVLQIRSQTVSHLHKQGIRSTGLSVRIAFHVNLIHAV
jgi:hypothetical protein